jgi:hypothetical protein
MKKMKLIAVAILSLAMSSCVNSGAIVSDNQIKNIKVGVSTEKDVIATLGKPNSISRNSNGKRFIRYEGVSGSIVPFSKTKISATTFEIGRNGKVTHISKDDSDY